MEDNINDRGAKKWGKLIIPEFKENLEQIYNSPISARSLDETTSIEKLILSVTGHKIRVAINYNPNGTVYEICGYILKWNQHQGIVSLLDDEENIKDFNFAYIENMKIVYP